MAVNASDFGFSIAGQIPASSRCVACGSLQLDCCDGDVETLTLSEPWSLARSLGFDDQDEFDDYCDDMERKNNSSD